MIPGDTPTGICTYEAQFLFDMKHLVPILIGMLALLGFADSVYMTLVHFEVISPISMESSGVCTLTGNSCSNVILSPKASVAGVPHAVLGAAYFAVLLGAVGLRLLTGRWFLPYFMLAFLLAGFAFSIYLTHQLLFKLHAPCPFCLAAHAINAVVLVLYAISMRSEPSNETRGRRVAFMGRTHHGPASS